MGEAPGDPGRARARLGAPSQGQRDVTFDIREGAKTKIKKYREARRAKKSKAA